MKIFVATSETQGTRANDFCFTTEGEIVRLGFECDGETVDGACGCRRSLFGVRSRKATTTFKVVEMEIDEAELAAEIFVSMKEAGWVLEGNWDFWRAGAAREARELLRDAASFEIGDVVERRGAVYRCRRPRKSNPSESGNNGNPHADDQRGGRDHERA